MNARVALLVGALSVVGAASQARGDDGLALFENHIRPVLVASCYECHSSEAGASEGELTLDNRAGVLRGGKSGPAIVPGKPGESRMLRAIEHHEGGLQMPPEGRLADEVIEAFRYWIALGAPDPRDGSAPQIDTIAGRAAEHWAYHKPERPPLPPDPSGWSETALDRLVVNKLRSEGLSPSPPASRERLVRRLYFDLVGLAPSAKVVDRFVGHDNPDAYESLVDQLLASPRFGERWARHWLDVARFADTKGYVFTESREFPNAYKYRDWVIDSFNQDRPIDQFLKLQLAADRMLAAEQQDNLAAHGFVTLGRRFINNPHDIIADRIDVIFRGMMGVTVACARCHDHKYDPISDEDYYALYGMFASSQEEQDEIHPLRLVEKDKPENVGVFIRGAAHNRGEIVNRGFPEFFASFARSVETGSGRLELAEAIAHGDNPLTARVFVNRVWGHLFGAHLVATPSDFGLRCPPPEGQPLLDLLAVDFVEHGWSLKWLVRQLVSSSTYRQSSTANPQLLAVDPENQWWGRANRRRLDFESLRDRLLDAAGELDLAVGGPSEDIAGADGGRRRTLYAQIDRQNLPGVFRTFDFATPDAHSPQRPHTLVPQQALFLMNSKLVQRVVTSVVRETEGSTFSKRVDHIYRRILSRTPTTQEVALARQFFAERKPQRLPADEWSFGFGDVAAGAVHFQPLTHFAENRWQPRGEFPDQQLGYVSVTARGGHPGNNTRLNSIRRWTAPHTGRLSIQGQLHRPEKKGDGVDGHIVSSKRGVLAEWTVETGAKSTAVAFAEVKPGEHIDFVVSCRANDNYDTYHWNATLTLEHRGDRQTWNTEQTFRGPMPEPLDLWSQYAQVLLMSNEFLYVD